MKKIFRFLLFRFIFYSQFHVLCRKIFQNKKVSVLLFHECDEKVFEKVIIYLKHYYQIIPLKDYINQNIHPSPKKPYLIITFDDGCISNFKLLSIIKKYNIPVTIYLIHNYLFKSEPFWWNYDNLTPKKVEQLKRVSNKTRLNKITKIKMSSYNKNQRDSLNLEEIAKMKNYIDFQSHTLSHPILTSCNKDEIISELKDSKRKISYILNKDVFHFAYPNGNYNTSIINILKNLNYQSAVTIEFGFNKQKLSSNFKIKRIIAGEGTNFIETIVCASGIYGLLKRYLFFSFLKKV